MVIEQSLLEKAIVSYNLWMDQYGNCRSRYTKKMLSVINRGYQDGYLYAELDYKEFDPSWNEDERWHYDWARSVGKKRLEFKKS